MKRFLRYIIGVGLICALWLLGPTWEMSAIAATASAPPVCNEPTTAKTLVDQTLHDIPRGFYGILKTDQLQAKMAAENPLLIDVREPSEFRAGHIPGAMNIPLRDLSDRLDEIPQDRSVVLYCSTGYRTGIGVMALHLLGYDNVQGYPPSYQGWLRDVGDE
jgi:rhodanese-related sulfurtransferase